MSKEKTIYLVDDDASARRGLKRLLLAAGYEVKDFAHAEELLKSNITDKNSCLILDARMPGLSGMALYDALAAKGIDLSTIFVTADNDQETRNKAMALKATVLFRKPVDGPALLDAIAWTLQTRERDDERRS